MLTYCEYIFIYIHIHPLYCVFAQRARRPCRLQTLQPQHTTLFMKHVQTGQSLHHITRCKRLQADATLGLTILT